MQVRKKHEERKFKDVFVRVTENRVLRCFGNLGTEMRMAWLCSLSDWDTAAQTHRVEHDTCCSSNSTPHKVFPGPRHESLPGVWWKVCSGGSELQLNKKERSQSYLDWEKQSMDREAGKQWRWAAVSPGEFWVVLLGLNEEPLWGWSKWEVLLIQAWKQPAEPRHVIQMTEIKEDLGTKCICCEWQVDSLWEDV